MSDEIEGPFGLWPFPVLNAIIKVVRLRNTDEFPAVDVKRDDQGDITEIEPKNE